MPGRKGGRLIFNSFRKELNKMLQNYQSPGRCDHLVGLEDLLDEVPVLLVHRQHVLHEVRVHAVALWREG